ncbi:unnamed protein product [Lactuca virosa]|uniref:Uncharacterized protein n=1 Tax=Lactuca virosa TaxID=75947 RepID=A0AAU9ME59_9ASTR|nr:unnamed protein product [Lactuca virosa]
MTTAKSSEINVLVPGPDNDLERWILKEAILERKLNLHAHEKEETKALHVAMERAIARSEVWACIEAWILGKRYHVETEA